MPDDAAETILVVYDSRTIRETVSIFGLETAFRVVEVDDPEQALSSFSNLQPDLILLCAMTRQTRAFELCRSLKAAAGSAFVPVVIYTLKAGAKERELALEAGADDSIQVTLAPEELLSRVRALLRIRGIVQESRRRAQAVARASAEAADMMLQLEEANRRIGEQNDELARMVRELEDRDSRIRAQQAEIEKHLETLQQEMELAAALQINLLPTTPPECGGLSLFDRYVPAAALCGDYYDYLALPDGSFHISIADVTGHGVAPALVSVQVRTLARSASLAGKSPAAVLAELNRFMIDTFKQDFLMTMACLTWHPQKGAVTFSGAGHCPLLHLPADATTPKEIPSAGLPLGVTDAAAYTDRTIRLAPGDRLLLYTDGIFEAPGDGGEIYGMERFSAEFAARAGVGGQEVLDALLRAARSHSLRGAFDDDVTLVLLERETA